MDIFQEQIFHCILIRHCLLYEISNKLLHIVVPQTFGGDRFAHFLVFCVVFVLVVDLFLMFYLCLLNSSVLSIAVLVVHFVLLFAFTLLVPCCDIRYDFHTQSC
jgi:hypothetical protein